MSVENVWEPRDLTMRRFPMDAERINTKGKHVIQLRIITNKNGDVVMVAHKYHYQESLEIQTPGLRNRSAEIRPVTYGRHRWFVYIMFKRT